MNTLLPFPDFNKSAECLDDTRLNKQRSDVIQILKAIAANPNPAEDEKEHPSIKMWRGNEPTLIKYGMAVCLEWASRGNTDATLRKIMGYKSTFEESSQEPPEWIGDEALHDAHKAHLLRLKPTHYRQFWPDMSDEAHMVWPRSPQKNFKTAEQRERDARYKKAVKAKEALEKAQRLYEEACEASGLNPETFEFVDGAEVVEIGVPDPDLIDL